MLGKASGFLKKWWSMEQWTCLPNYCVTCCYCHLNKDRKIDNSFPAPWTVALRCSQHVLVPWTAPEWWEVTLQGVSTLQGPITSISLCAKVHLVHSPVHYCIVCMCHLSVVHWWALHRCFPQNYLLGQSLFCWGPPL